MFEYHHQENMDKNGHHVADIYNISSFDRKQVI